MLSATSMTLAFCDAGLSISPATCAATNRLISASTPATIRSTSARSDLDVTWMEMSEAVVSRHPESATVARRPVP